MVENRKRFGISKIAPMLGNHTFRFYFSVSGPFSFFKRGEFKLLWNLLKTYRLFRFDADRISIPQERIEAVGFSLLCSLNFPDLRIEFFQRELFSSSLLFFF